MAAKTSKARKGRNANDDFYTKLRERVSAWAKRSDINPKYRDYVLALPDLFHLVVKLSLDKRVDMASKATLAAALAWAVMPFDLMPDFIGPLGFIDDLLVLVLALDFMIDRTPRAVVQEHWAGSGDVFAIIRNVLDQADQWLGRGLYQKIRSTMDSAMKRDGSRRRTGSGSASGAGSPPQRRTTAPKTAARKTAARKTAARKTAARKSTPRKSTAAAPAKAAAARPKAARPKAARKATAARKKASRGNATT